MPRRFEMLSNRIVYDAFFPVREVQFRHTKIDGTMSRTLSRVAMEVGGVASCILLKAKERRVILVEQFRCPVMQGDGGWFVELVGGLIEPGETAEEAIRREAREETGYELGELTPIYRYHPAPGTIIEHVTMFVAEAGERVSAGGGHDADEDLRVLEWSYEEYFEALDSGAIKDAKALIAGQWLRQGESSRLVGTGTST